MMSVGVTDVYFFFNSAPFFFLETGPAVDLGRAAHKPAALHCMLWAYLKQKWLYAGLYGTMCQEHWGRCGFGVAYIVPVWMSFDEVLLDL